VLREHACLLPVMLWYSPLFTYYAKKRVLEVPLLPQGSVGRPPHKLYYAPVGFASLHCATFDDTARLLCKDLVRSSRSRLVRDF